MSKIIISCDSTADMPESLIKDLDIKVYGLPVILGDKKHIDGVDVVPADLFKYAEETGKLATTSAANVADYTELFKGYTEDGSTVIHFIISSTMSAAYNNARIAAEDMENVHVINSKNLSSGIGYQVIVAAQMAKAGASAEEILNKLNDMQEKMDCTFILDTLKYLHKGGRCSAVAALGANVLKLKPCIEVRNGEMRVGKKYRGKLANVLCEYTDNIIAQKDDIVPDIAFVTHTCLTDELPNMVADRLEKSGIFDKIYKVNASSSIAVHCGPDTLGIIFLHRNRI